MLSPSALNRVSKSVRWTERQATNLVGRGTGGYRGTGFSGGEPNYPLENISKFDPPTPTGSAPNYDNWKCLLTINTNGIVIGEKPESGPDTREVSGRGWGKLTNITMDELPEWDITQYFEDIEYEMPTEEAKTEVLALAFNFINDEYQLSAYLAGGLNGKTIQQRNLGLVNEIVAYIEVEISKTSQISIRNIEYIKGEYDFVEEIEYLYPIVIDEANTLIKVDGTSFKFIDLHDEEVNYQFEEDVFTFDYSSLDEGAHNIALYQSGITNSDDGEFFILEADGLMNEKSCIPLASFELDSDKNIVRYVNRSPIELHKLPFWNAYLNVNSSSTGLKLNISDYKINCGSKTFNIEATELDVTNDEFYSWLKVSFNGDAPIVKSGNEAPVNSNDGSFNLKLFYIKSIEVDSKRELVDYLEYEDGWHNYYGAGIWG